MSLPLPLCKSIHNVRTYVRLFKRKQNFKKMIVPRHSTQTKKVIVWERVLLPESCIFFLSSIIFLLVALRSLSSTA